jgi:UDP:flavonoid glycosyltransferase YjiC (YdhE family)
MGHPRYAAEVEDVWEGRIPGPRFPTTDDGRIEGRPVLAVPYGWDQPDNAARIERLGTGLRVTRSSDSPNTGINALHHLTYEPHFATRAPEIGAEMEEEEEGQTLGCNAIETPLQTSALESG